MEYTLEAEESLIARVPKLSPGRLHAAQVIRRS